jgi:two-component system response regulator WspF
MKSTEMKSAPDKRRGASNQKLVAIGSSAGGPAALAVLLGALNKDFDAAIVIAQHVDQRFAGSMADWLNQVSPLPVRVAKEGDHAEPGLVLLAATNDHLKFKGANLLGYTAEPHDYAYRPSVNVLFESVQAHWRGEAVGVLLTGMGRDGAQGLKLLRDKGFHTIAQDEQTSMVYGMPKAAVSLGAAVDILPLERIAPRIIELLKTRSPPGVPA